MRWWRTGSTPSLLTDASWATALQALPVLRCLNPSDATRLRALSEQFLRSKIFEGAQGLVVTDRMRAEVAAQACLLILHLGLDYYTGWQTIILYPGDFRVARESIDEDGIVHHWTEELSGESWEQGPVILSWEAATNTASDINIVLHEFAHKLDMRAGAANGCPPLHPGMSVQEWQAVFTDAYAHFQMALEHDEMGWLDDYAAESPAEFFAVLSEVFFLRPRDFLQELPMAYKQLALFYGQDPHAALATEGA